MDETSTYKPSTRHSTFSRWFHNFLNSGQTDGAPIEVLYINAVTLIGIADVIISILIEYSNTNVRMAMFMGFIALCASITLIILRINRNTSLASSILLLILLFMLSGMLLDGMFQQTAPIWFATFPAVAFFFKGKREGLLWLSALIFLMLLLMLAQSTNRLHSPFSNSTLALLIMNVITMGMLVSIYETMRAKGEAALHKARKQLHLLAHSDPLTGLPNRIAFYDRLTQALIQADQSGGRLAVLFIDLDNFKPINDTFGHETGDRVLSETAVRLREKLRGSDFLARFGGDEFVAILCNIADNNEADRVADKLVHQLDAPFTINGQHCRIGASIGIGLYPDCASTVDNLVQLADHAMYTAKLGGKNGYSHCPVNQADRHSQYKGQYSCNGTCLSTNG